MLGGGERSDQRRCESYGAKVMNRGKKASMDVGRKWTGKGHENRAGIVAQGTKTPLTIERVLG